MQVICPAHEIHIFLSNIISKWSFVDIPSWWTALLGSAIDWNFQIVPQKNAFLSRGNTTTIPRGKVLGGTSGINGMSYVRGNRHDYDHWESLGNPGWGYDDVLPYFIKSEKIGIPDLKDSEYHDSRGELNIEYPLYSTKVKDVVLDAADEMGIRNEVDDYNGRHQFGVSRTQFTMRHGLRCSTSKAFLHPASDRPNLHISLSSFVTKIGIDHRTKRASHVHFIRDGVEYRIKAQKEIILSAGTLQSPQILLLSGVGDEKQLKKHGIKCIQNLPGVGENLHDHVGLFPSFTIKNPDGDQPLSIISEDVLTRKTINEFIKYYKGLVLSHSFETVAFVNSKYQNASLDWPDIQCVFGSTIDFAGVVDKAGRNVDGILVVAYVLRPDSRGRVYLKSKNPFEYPLIDPKYLTANRDIDIAVSNNLHRSFSTAEILIY